MCLIKRIKDYDKPIAHKSKLDAQNMKKVGSKEFLICFKTGLSYIIYLKYLCSLPRAQLDDAPLANICTKPHKSEFYSHPMNSQVRLGVVPPVRDIIKKSEDVNILWKSKSSDGV